MTLSLIARSADGFYGMVISSSSPAVAARCMNLAAGVGAAASQNVTNPALGPATLASLGSGTSASQAIAAALATDPHPEYRQVTAIGPGAPAAATGARSLGVHGHVLGTDCVAAGNLLAGEDVLEAMVGGFDSAIGTLEERLLIGLEAGVQRGGEAGPLRSAGLGVVEQAAWRVTDLRVDDHDDPIVELRRLVQLWMPQKAAYLTRALDPGGAPSYAVPGDR